MTMAGSIWPSALAARTTVSRRFSAPVAQIETVLAPLRLTVFELAMSKYMGVSSMLTIMFDGYLVCFRVFWTDWIKFAIFSSRAAGSFWAMDVFALIVRLFLRINFWTHPLLPLNDGQTGWMVRTARSMMFPTLTDKCRSRCSKTHFTNSSSISVG